MARVRQYTFDYEETASLGESLLDRLEAMDTVLISKDEKIAELQEEIEDLKSEVRELESKIEELEAGQ